MTNEEAIEILQSGAGIWPMTDRANNALNKAIKALEQEPKTGHWISHYDEDEKVGWYECDRCHIERAFNTDYCPDCGAKMIEPQESEEQA